MRFVTLDFEHFQNFIFLHFAKVMWIVPRFLLSWRRDVRPHVVLKSLLTEQLMHFCFGTGAILPQLRDSFDANGKVCKHFSLIDEGGE